MSVSSGDLPSALSFDFDSFARLPVLDGHVHIFAGCDPLSLWQSVRFTGAERCNALSITSIPKVGIDRTGWNRLALEMKAFARGQAFAFGSLEYTPLASPENLVAQAEQMWDEGFDGIKLWEGKPSVYVHLPGRLDGPFYEPFWDWMEARGMPALMHHSDPARFWDPARVGLDPWSYVHGEYPSREDMYAELDHILDRHPRLKIIFAHFLFFWNEPARASRFLNAHPSAMLDLAPGVEGYVLMSEAIEAMRDLFLRFQDRIVYGTDLGAGPVVNSSVRFDPRLEIAQAWLVRTMLETDCDLTIPPGIGAVTSQYVGRRLRGLHLPVPVLEQIYERNFARQVGPTPRGF